MKQLDILLALVLLACALAVVNAQHRARTLFIELEALKREARDLEVEWGKLQLEQGTLTSHARVEALAKTRLGLVTPPLDKVWLLEAGAQP
ncbi:MAG: cell division protein FtsL [Pseudomonadota bacterium]